MTSSSASVVSFHGFQLLSAMVCSPRACSRTLARIYVTMKGRKRGATLAAPRKSSVFPLTWRPLADAFRAETALGQGGRRVTVTRAACKFARVEETGKTGCRGASARLSRGGGVCPAGDRAPPPPPPTPRAGQPPPPP